MRHKNPGFWLVQLQQSRAFVGQATKNASRYSFTLLSFAGRYSFRSFLSFGQGRSKRVARELHQFNAKVGLQRADSLRRSL
jgi:hypothetical protein